MFEKLRDLKSLISPAYFGDLKTVVLAVLSGDWQQAHTGLFELARKATADMLFGESKEVSMAACDGETETSLDAALADLEQSEGTTKGTAKTVGAGFDPGTWIMIAQAVAAIIQAIRDRKK